MKLLRNRAAVIALAWAAFASTPLVAQDAKTIPASFCSYLGSTTDRPTFDAYGAAANPAASVRQFACPVPRETWTVPDYVRVWVLDNHATSNVKCRLYFHLDAFGLQAWGDEVSSSGQGYQTLDLDVPTDQFYDYGAYTIECRVPASTGTPSALLGYTSGE